jgi:TolB-like protein/DNA-binding winged helix-turn-helix (wHTH) protein/Tfp pilus assembly protein PilF
MNANVRRKDDETSPNVCNVPAESTIYVFAGFALDMGRQSLCRGTEQIRLRPRTYDVLTYLVKNAGRLVEKQELMDSVWSGVAVTDDSLVQCLVDIRRALGTEDLVKTIRGRGYMLDAEVRPPAVEPPQADEPAKTEPGTRKRRMPPVHVVLLGSALLLMLVVAAIPIAQSLRAPVVRVGSLAVLPLENLSRDVEQEYFADGMTDELITHLAKISALRVISRTSVMRFKGTRKSLPEIARELNVDAVVEGTVERSAQRVRVTAQLIQVNPEQHLWAERYERPLGDVVVLQGELARRISDAIHIKLTPQDRQRLALIQPVDQQAYEAYLKGRYYWGKRTEEATKKAIEFFTRAVEKKPDYALAYVGLADCYYSLSLSEALQEVLPPQEALTKALAAIQRALAIEDRLGEAHASRGIIRWLYERDWPGAEAEFKRAIELNPNYANAHHWYGINSLWVNRGEQARAEVQRARQLDPLSLVINANLGFVFAATNAHAEGIDQCRKTLEMDPNFAHAYFRLGQIYVLMGRNEDAITELQKAISLSGGSSRAVAELGLAYAQARKKREARKLIDELTEKSKQHYVSAFNFAVIYGGLGETERTLEWLEKADQERSPSLNLLNFSPAFRKLQGHPRFTELVRRAGLQ